MFDYLVDDNFIDIEKDECEFVKNVIHSGKSGPPSSDAHRGYLYEIVANSRNGIDVDKFDYMVSCRYIESPIYMILTHIYYISSCVYSGARCNECGCFNYF